MFRSAASGACFGPTFFSSCLKMSIVIAVAYYGVRGAGGMHAMFAKLAASAASPDPEHRDITAMFPDFSRGLTGEALWTLPVLTFSCTWEFNGGHSGIRVRNRAAADISRSEFSARAMNGTDCFRCCGSTSRTMHCVRGPGF